MADNFKTGISLWTEQEFSSEDDGSARTYVLDDTVVSGLNAAEEILIDVDTLTLSSGTARVEVELYSSSLLDRRPRHGGKLVGMIETPPTVVTKLTISQVGIRRADTVDTLRARTEAVLRVFDSAGSPQRVTARHRLDATVKG